MKQNKSNAKQTQSKGKGKGKVAQEEIEETTELTYETMSHNGQHTADAGIVAFDSMVGGGASLGSAIGGYSWLAVGAGVAALGAGAAALGGGGGSTTGHARQEGIDGTTHTVALASDVTATAENIADSSAELLYIIDEERMARDVYDALYIQTGIKTFDNISNSEQVHYDSVLTSAINLGIDTSGLSTTAGVYTNPEIQALYDDLMALGSKSTADAINVGILIEQTDIADLQLSIEANAITSLDSVYSTLLSGSYNHLDAFQSQVVI